jgi:hypothetical protein
VGSILQILECVAHPPTEPLLQAHLAGLEPLPVVPEFYSQFLHYIVVVPPARAELVDGVSVDAQVFLQYLLGKVLLIAWIAPK